MFALSQSVGFRCTVNATKPSWLPQWKATNVFQYTAIKYRLCQEQLFAAGRPSKPVHTNGDELVLSGIVVDTIARANINRWEDSRFIQIPNITFLHAWGHEAVFWEMWTWGQEPEGQILERCTKDFIESCVIWGREYQGGGNPKFYNNYWSNMDIPLWSSVFFTTLGGMLGLSERAVKPGDKVCVLAGANMPFIVRPGDTNTYTLVSECFVKGTMDGEATHGRTWSKDTRRWNTNDRYRWQSIVLK